MFAWHKARNGIILRTMEWLKVFMAIIANFLTVTHCKKVNFTEFRGEHLDSSEQMLVKGENAAAQYCSGCHLTPSPLSMAPNTANVTLAYMGLFIGIDASRTLTHPVEKQYFQARHTFLKASHQIPATPGISRDQWLALRNYYLSMAKSPSAERISVRPPQSGRQHFNFNDHGITLLRAFDDDQIAIGGGVSNLLQISDLTGKVIREKKFSSPPVWIEKVKNGYLVLTLGDLLGALNPKESSELWSIGPAGDTRLMDHLLRSSHFEVVKTTSGANGILISAFGTLGKGKFSLFTQQPSGFREQIISRRDSHVRSHVIECGGALCILSLVAGAREQLILFRDSGTGFSETVLTEYPPHFGSVWLEVADLDGDGEDEILVLSGDAADAGPFNEMKDDQGLRIYNLRGNKIHLRKFLSVPGGLSMHLVKNGNKITHITIARFYAPIESGADLAVLVNKSGMNFERLDYRLDSRPTVLTSYRKEGNARLLIGSGNLPKGELINGKMQYREYAGPLLSEIILPD